MTLRRRILAAAVLGGVLTAGTAVSAEEVNVYTSRHYDTDLAIYDAFTEATGIEVNLIEDKAGALIERIKAEGANSPADVLITVDAANLAAASEAGFFQSADSATLNERVPESLRHPDGYWYALTKRARIIMYRKDDVDVTGLERYEDLADPRFDDMICIRSSSNVYNQSLVSSLIAVNGSEAAEAWVDGLIENFARDPQSNDTGQIKAVVAGECDIAVANTYYLARLRSSDDPENRAIGEAVAVIMPNQGDRGTHINVSGAGVLKNAPNRDNAVKLLEYLVSDEGQRAFAEGNNEWPSVDGVPHAVILDDLYGDFVEDDLNPALYGANRVEAVEMMEAHGWE
ncbi:MAG: extracellular solute-binding protein [Pseudomonadota bacterium]